ncbi:MAG: cysteinyl-tRNA synthetase [Pseudomonadota bacterium]
MPPRFHDTLREQVIPLQPIEPGHVRLYVCGPTVYDHPHLGHMRSCVVYDVLVRHLREQGLRVTHVRNITDIDDRIVQRAAERGEDIATFAARYTQSYREATERLFCVPPTHEPHVTEHLPEVCELIARLVERGAAYVSDGDVYYSVSNFADYGKLSHRKLADLEAGASGRTADEEARRKRHPADFALWKGSNEQPNWPSPWGPGRPGWHIECSAMCLAKLGETCDIHGGGLDLVFPHHENEIAQSEAVSGKPLASLWIHNGFIEVNKTKMSKSLGNFFTVSECFRVVEPEALRYFTLTTHYRSPLNLDWVENASGQVTSFPQIEECERRVEYLYATQQRLATFPEARIDANNDRVEPELLSFKQRLSDVLDDDLNLPQALSVVADLLKRVNEGIDVALRKQNRLGRASYTCMQKNFAALGRVLGLGLDDAQAFQARVRARRAQVLGLREDDVEAKIAARIAARKQRDFASADAIRNELLALGIELMDEGDQTHWRVA